MGVYRDGKVVYAHGYGMANLNDDVTITPETVFHVASMSKQFTAASILLLQEQGKLSLDDDVHKYIPELPEFGEKITLRNLVHHTSGLRDQWELLELSGWRYSQDLITDEDVMSVVTRQKELNFKPGEKYMYSNTGFTLLALVVKRVSGMSLREFTTKNIFEPLGMTHTHFRDDHEEVILHDALGYEQDDKSKAYRMSLTNFDTTGATSLHTTVEDLELWDENFYHPKVGGQALIDGLQHRDKLNDGALQDYAAGLVIGKYRGLPTVDHNGADAGYRSDLIRFPEQHFSTAVLCNAAESNPARLAKQVVDVLLEKELQPVEKPKAESGAVANLPELTATQMEAIEGTYWNQKEDDFATVQVKDGRLMLGDDPGDLHALKQFAPGHFHAADVAWGNDIDLHFADAITGRKGNLEQSFNGGKVDVYEPVAGFAPDAARLEGFAGAYASEEIDPVYRITVADGKLMLQYVRHAAKPLHPVMADTFDGDIGVLHFKRDAKGKVTGFVLNAGRIQGLKFTRKQ